MTETVLHARRTLWSRGLVATGIVIAVLNMALAWTMLFLGPSSHGSEQPSARPAAAQAVEPSAAEPDTARRPPPGGASRGPRIDDVAPSTDVTMAKVFEMSQAMSQSEERQTTLLLGFCFALMSIGFSLFVMGIEGAADFVGDAKEFGSLAIKVSSPGILCIFLSALLIALGIGGLSRSAPIPAEGKADEIRAEYEGKVQAVEAEARAKEEQVRSEADAKERLIDAEARAKRDLIEAETEAKERLRRLESAPVSRK